MDFDWLDSPFDLKKITPKEIEESFEDPFSLRILPDLKTSQSKARYISLGKSVAGTPILSVFWTDGKTYRVILARRMSDQEHAFYERKNAEMSL